jgi:hypothetical protein
MFGTGNFTRLGTSNRTAGALMVGAGGSRTGAGSLSRVYNWCHSNSTDALACTLGSSNGPSPPAPPTSLVSWVASELNLLYGSRDGTTWELCTTQPFPVSSTGTTFTGVPSIVYGNNVWVAGCVNVNAGQGNASILHSLAYSYDGMNWFTVQNDPFTGTKPQIVGCYSIAFADGWFVAAGVSQGGTILAYSRDGIQWKNSTVGSGNYGTSIVYAGGTWLLTYLSTTGQFYTSYSNQPSSSWSDPLLQDFESNIVSVYPTNTVGEYSWFSHAYQTNDVKEKFQEVSGLPSNNISNIASGKIGNETTLACFSCDDNSLYTSSDGVVWENKQKISGITGDIFCLLYGNNVWVAGGVEGLFYSEDGITWNNSINGRAVNIAFNRQQWQSIKSNDYKKTTMYYSQNGKDWVESSSFDFPIITMQSNIPETIFTNNHK